MKIYRRELVKAGLGLGAGLTLTGGRSLRAQTVDVAPTRFDDSTVRSLAQGLASRSYQPPQKDLPDALAHMTFDQFSSIQFNAEKTLWGQDHLAFDVEFFPRGYLYRQKVDVFEVENGAAHPVPCTADMFSSRDASLNASTETGFSGLRIRYALNHPGVMEECAVFLGASYFRAVAKGQSYGLSARGFAKDTGTPTGEEFPVFRAFWLEKPAAGSQSLVLHALMDSPSLTGAFRFTIRPGETTLFDVQSSFFPRVDITAGGIAPLTGMYYFDANDRTHVNDWRPAAHDSEALQIWTGAGQNIYRPLTNPTDLQLSSFSDAGPYGYGLMQRKRSFHDYEDLALHYEKRPSLWVEPVGNWGEGSVNLVEIPTPSEVNDNIVSFWRPQKPMKAGQSYNFTYRMYWGWDTPWPTHLARIHDTRVGAVTDHPEKIQFVLDFDGEPFRSLPNDTAYHLIAQTSAGTIETTTLMPNPEINGIRAFFQLTPGTAKLCELQVQLANAQGPVSETWLYRWTP